MREQFLWSPKWTESKIVAVDANAGFTVKQKGSGFLSTVVFPMPEGGVELDDSGELITTLQFLPEFMPFVEFWHWTECSPSDYVTKRPNKVLAPSVRALLRLADDWTIAKTAKRRKIDAETGWHETMKVSSSGKSQSLRRRWLIAWQWPNLNRPHNGSILNNEERAELLNRYMSEIGWDEPITAGTLKTTANRMELYFPG